MNKKSNWPLSVVLFSLLALVLLLPLALVLLWSVVERWSAPDLWPSALTLSRWSSVLADENLLTALVSSLSIAVVVTLLTAVLALPTAWSLSRLPGGWRRGVELFVLAPIIVPGIVIGISVVQVLLMLGLAYTMAGVVLVQTLGTLPLMVRILAARFEAIPDELVLAARTLGARPLQVAWHVLVPLAMPALLSGALLSFVGSFEEFDKSFLVGAPSVQTLPVLLYYYLDPYSLQIPLAAVVALILLAPLLIVFVLSGRVKKNDVLAAGMGKV